MEEHFESLYDPKVGQIVKGEVVKVEKDHLLIDLRAFTEGKMFLDNYDIPAPKTFDGLIKVGDIVEAKIMKVSIGDHSSVIFLSRLPLLKQNILKQIEEAAKEGSIISTTVKKVADKGLILAYEGYELFLPLSLLDNELKNKKDELVGTKLDVIVEEIKKQPRLRIVASRKPIYEQARKIAQEKRFDERQAELASMKAGQILEGKVEKIEPHAALIRFNHVLGFLRISQISHHRIDKISDHLKVGQKVAVKVIKVEGAKIDLSMKALEKTPYDKFIEEHKQGDKIKGKVIQKLPFGLVIELAQDVSGLLHRSEFSWNPNDNLMASVVIGDEIETAVIGKDPKNKRISLSIKVFEENPWIDANFKVGSNYDVLITAVERDHLAVIAQKIDGVIKASEAAIDKIKLEDHFKVGETVKAKVLKFDRHTWQFELSIKRYLKEIERKEIDKYLESVNKEDEKITLGDIFTLDKKK